MIVAMTQAEHGDGRRVLIIGLEAENLERLRNDEPIRHELVELLAGAPDAALDVRLRDLVLYVLGPEDTVRLQAQARREGRT